MAGFIAAAMRTATEGARLAETGRREIGTALSPMIGRLSKSRARQLTVLLEEFLTSARP
jgi:hypothetical protein